MNNKTQISDSEYQYYDQIVANTINYSIDYWLRNHEILISEYYYNLFHQYYDSLLKITFNIYIQNPIIKFTESSLKFRINFYKKFNKKGKIKFFNCKNNVLKPKEIWNPAAKMYEETKYFNEIWKEYYDVENA